MYMNYYLNIMNKKIKSKFYARALPIIVLIICCGNVYSAGNKMYPTYKGLIMAGYQGWFNCEGDGSGESWNHYSSEERIKKGYISIDSWPYTAEYENKYKTNFVYPNGEPAYLFSSYDKSTVMTHFRWMKEYGIDGVFIQRFVDHLLRREDAINTVLNHAMKASKKYDRAICLMYDMSRFKSEGQELYDSLITDFEGINKKYDFRNTKNYLHHNGKPLIGLWGVGNKSRSGHYSLEETERIIDYFKANNFSVLVGTSPTWRTLDQRSISDPHLHEVFKKVDIVFPWMGGDVTIEEVETKKKQRITADMEWCKKNGIDFVPVANPGFSWHNMQPTKKFNEVPREKGMYFWAGLTVNIEVGAEMIYVAMFDEVDEATAIFKCVQVVPLKPKGSKARTRFVPYEVPPDHYLWLTGMAGKMLRQEIPFSKKMPERNLKKHD